MPRCELDIRDFQMIQIEPDVRWWYERRWGRYTQLVLFRGWGKGIII